MAFQHPIDCEAEELLALRLIGRTEIRIRCLDTVFVQIEQIRILTNNRETKRVYRRDSRIGKIERLAIQIGSLLACFGRSDRLPEALADLRLHVRGRRIRKGQHQQPRNVHIASSDP